MKSIKTIWLLLFFLNWSLLNAQEMDKGFSSLENGQFAEAETFFSNILVEYPQNKTATICYARAVGLNGNPKKATGIFSDLLELYPTDLEIKLNFGESLLWNQQYELAEKYYTKLEIGNPEDFGVVLGLANSLSNLKKFEEATAKIARALEISPGNATALNSLKFIRLGMANSQKTNGDYSRAARLLNENLKDFPNDPESLQSLAEIYLEEKKLGSALETYRRLKKAVKDSITALVGISLVHHLGKEEKKALKFALRALQASTSSLDPNAKITASERYIQALIWNARYKEADELIKKALQSSPNHIRFLVLEATLNMYTGEFRKSRNTYLKILELEPRSFDANLGLANAYFALEDRELSKEAVNQTLEIYPGQTDALLMLQKIEDSWVPNLQERVSYSFDNGENHATAFGTQLRVPASARLEFMGNYINRSTWNTISGKKGESNQLSLTGIYRLNSLLKFRINAGLIDAFSEAGGYTSLIGEFAVKIKAISRNDLEIGYTRDVQDFNADLLNRQIIGNHYFIKSNYTTRSGLGWYLQYLKTSQSDENNRDLLFTSVYYSILKKPVLKTGLNFQYISFKKRRPQLYFSPEEFKAAELFLSFTGNESQSRLNYEITGATGFQYIEEESAQLTYRLRTAGSLRLGTAFQLGIFGNHSNIASTTAAGFSYSEFGLNLKWFPLRRPVFSLDR